MSELLIRPVEAADHGLVVQLLGRSWGGTAVVAHGTLFDASTLPGLLAERAGQPVGLLTYRLDGDGLEVVTIDADPPHGGAGCRAAVEAGHPRGRGVRYPAARRAHPRTPALGRLSRTSPDRAGAGRRS